MLKIFYFNTNFITTTIIYAEWAKFDVVRQFLEPISHQAKLFAQLETKLNFVSMIS